MATRSPKWHDNNTRKPLTHLGRVQREKRCKSTRKFSELAIDQAREQNNALIKCESGRHHLNPSHVMVFVELSKLAEEYEEIFRLHYIGIFRS